MILRLYFEYVINRISPLYVSTLTLDQGSHTPGSGDTFCPQTLTHLAHDWYELKFRWGNYFLLFFFLN